VERVEAGSRQSTCMAHIGGAVQQLETMTQQNAARVEQSAAAAESLRGQADGLNTLVQAFRLK
jgi:methyl-accepting chemotaxis protein